MWSIVISEHAEKDLDVLDGAVYKRVIEKLRWMEKNFDEITPLPLSGDWSGFFKLRIGDWHVIYNIDEKKKQIIIHFIGHRREVYRS
jgi:mRNA interferase RelE/StbE